VLTLLCAFSWLLLPLPSYAGHWVITLNGSSAVPPLAQFPAGNLSFTDSVVTGPSPFNAQFHYSLNFNNPAPVNGSECDFSYDQSPGTTTLSVTAKLTWKPDSPADTSQPPPTVNVLETGYAGSSEHISSGGNASDGLGDSMIGDMACSSGSHLQYLTVPAGQTSVTLASRSLSASWHSPPLGSYDTGSPGMSMSYTVQIDSREVSISSSIDPTYHKDSVSNQPVQNQPAPDGTMNADSVQLGDVSNAAITYFANPVGSWAANSSYHWYSALTGYSGAGTFTLPSDPPYGLDVPYGNNVNFANQEHINLHCTDAGDGASATANYYVNWHNDIDGWITVVDTKDYGPITRVTAVYHPITNDDKYSQDFEATVKVDVKATGEGSLGSDKVGAKFGAEIGSEYETSTKVTTEYTWVANKYNWIERQSFWHHREGTVDNYGFHGYIGLLHWTLDSAYNPGTPLIDYNEYQRAEDAGPAY